MKKIKIVIVLMLFTATIYSQDKIILINDFIKAVFKEHKAAQFIADHYFYFEPITDSKVSATERMKFFEALLSETKKENSKILSDLDYQIVGYTDFKGKKIQFLHEPLDSFIVVQNNKPVLYLSLKEDRINSFTYVLKGDWAFFLTI